MSLLDSMIAGGARDESYRALSGSFFSARNPTPGTGIASVDAGTARSATAGVMSVYNAGTSKWIIPVRLWLRATAVNTSASDLHFAFYTDTANRWSSGGTAITEVAHYAEPNTTAPTSSATIYFGALTLAAATSEVKCYTREVSTTILAVDDTFDIWFGHAPSFHDQAAVTGHHETLVLMAPPMWIGPGASMLFQHWGASQAADPGWEFEFWYVEKA